MWYYLDLSLIHILTESSINTAYYQEYLKKIYIKGLDGIHFKLDKGPWDIFGENTSHTGTDLSLESPLSSKSPILLYDENFFQNDEDYDSQIDEMINSINYNEENIISALRDNDVELFNVISKDHINEKVLDFFLEDLDEKAKSKYMFLKNAEDISVSYTHLDVYKRQVSKRKSFRNFDYMHGQGFSKHRI